VEVFENENDQVEAVKRFFAENGKALIVGVVLGIGALVGWRYWGSHQAENASAASLAYQTISSEIQADKPQTLEALQKFATDNKNIYGSLASLELAQQYANKNELDKAATQLEDLPAWLHSLLCPPGTYPGRRTIAYDGKADSHSGQ